ncbi:MAG: hypothetical protein ACR2MB_12520 [Acidimicrobiales bacterium]
MPTCTTTLPLATGVRSSRNLATGESDLPLKVVHMEDDVFVKMNPK